MSLQNCKAGQKARTCFKRSPSFRKKWGLKRICITLAERFQAWDPTGFAEPVPFSSKYFVSSYARYKTITAQRLGHNSIGWTVLSLLRLHFYAFPKWKLFHSSCSGNISLDTFPTKLQSKMREGKCEYSLTLTIKPPFFSCSVHSVSTNHKVRNESHSLIRKDHRIMWSFTPDLKILMRTDETYILNRLEMHR